ncbi:3-hydroxyacyl-CoA dehydrogenase family protein [Chryseobacterium indoltheticum]|uniref:3-hydroxyacyl-CoA dehydrogenase family protein n=1 Tax=Chryseobacterium indoltheticum TaxID=254 RepID=UPI003F499EFE
MINESIETLYNGVAGVEEIDTVMKLGMAHPMGPLPVGRFYRYRCLFSDLKRNV